MARSLERVAMVSMHTSPAAQPGAGDAGSMNVAILGVAAELALRGAEVDLLTRAAGRPRVTELLPGVLLHELEAGSGPLAAGELAGVADEFGEAVAVLGRRMPFDVVHAHHWLSGLAALPVAIELGVPFVQSFHSLATMRGEQHERRLRSESFLSTQADAVIAASSAEAAVLIDRVGAPADRTWIIPPGVDLRLFAPRTEPERAAIRRRIGVEADRPLVVMAGRVHPGKGHELAVRALAELHGLRGWAPVLAIAGEVATGEEAFAAGVQRLAIELGVAAEVRWLGALDREALAELLGSADVTVMPSESEAFGLVALESAATATPVVASRTGGLVEAVGEGGVLLDSWEPHAWAIELAALLEHEERRSTLGIAARVHAERYTWAAAATGLLGVYAGARASRGLD